MKRPTENWIGSQELSKRYLLVSMLLSALFLMSCKSPQPTVAGTTSNRTETNYVRDTNITVAPEDSAAIKALIRCDSLNNALLTELSQKDGERIKPSLQLKQNEDGSLDIQFNCKEDSLQAEIELRDKVISEFQKETIVVEKEKDLSGWQKFIMGMGYALLGIIVLGIIALCIKIFL